jgi:hypothetical protein
MSLNVTGLQAKSQYASLYIRTSNLSELNIDVLQLQMRLAKFIKTLLLLISGGWHHADHFHDCVIPFITM